MLQEAWIKVREGLGNDVTLVAVSKTKTVEEIRALYDCGQRIFGENKIQEMVEKYHALPKDIQWHAIGHIQTNKIKYMAPFVSLVQGVDSLKVLQEIHKQAKKNHRRINCLLQVKIAKEQTKFGLSKDEVRALLSDNLLTDMSSLAIVGLMGMASNIADQEQLKAEFTQLSDLYRDIKEQYRFTTLSMGMSSDYKLAVGCGSNMVRVGSAIFGKRDYTFQ